MKTATNQKKFVGTYKIIELNSVFKEDKPYIE